MAELSSPESLLRTLSPALRELGRSVRAWLEGEHGYPLSASLRATLEGLAQDLLRQAEALQQDKPVLVIMLMGGTGVGKSTLLNALAGGTIAHASFARPTTRDPVVYFHESIQAHKLDPALQHCKLMVHDRPGLEQKVIVDTPDLDSNDLANRDKLHALLPVADIVLYVGSQEKYHDKLGWDLFLKHRQRRAFAFVLNKWDRCLNPSQTGVRPDEDLLGDLKAEGFAQPVLFRTCAQHWVDRLNAEGQMPNAERMPNEEMPNAEMSNAERRSNTEGQILEERRDVAANATTSGTLGIEPSALSRHSALDLRHSAPDGEQFQDLVKWLELGLNRLEIEAIKARGVCQLLGQVREALESAAPPDLSAAAARTGEAWRQSLADEARTNTELLLNTLEPYQKEIEHHFALQRQQQFGGIMGTYLRWFNRMRYAGSTLRDRIPFMPRVPTPVSTPADWDLASFTRACSNAAADRHLDARSRALANRLLVEAGQQGFPVDLLSAPTENASQLDWRSRYAQALVEVLSQVEHEWTRPTGARRWLQAALIFIADWLPLVAFAAMGVIMLWQYTMERVEFHLWDLAKLAAAPLLVMIVLHVLIALVLPLRWHAIQGVFQKQLEQRLAQELDEAFARIPDDTLQALREDQRRIEKLLADVREVTGLLEQREQAATIAGLYGR